MYYNLTPQQFNDINQEEKKRHEYMEKIHDITQEIKDLEEGRLIQLNESNISLSGEFAIDELERIIELKKEKNKLE